MTDFNKKILSLKDWNELSRDEQCAFKAKRRPTNDDELHRYIKDTFGIDIPRTAHPDCLKKSCPCTPPFKVFADAYFGRYSLILLRASRGSGKEQPLWSKILTTQGWTTMGALSVGDKVIDRDGNPVTVTHLHPQGFKEVYKVSFNDGTSTYTGADHLWTCRRVGKYKSKKTGEKRQRPWVTKSTLELKDDLFVGIRRKDLKWRIPIVEPISFDSKNLPLDPYVLGLLLGDGCLTRKTPTFSCHIDDVETVDRLKNLLSVIRVDTKLCNDGREINYSFPKLSGEKQNNLTVILKDLGLYGKNSHTKFIPKDYLLGSSAQRLSLLQGLMDTDGHASKNANSKSHKGVEYITASSDLAEDVIFLVQSLGGTAYRSIKKIKKYPENVYHRLYIKLPICPFRMQRKVNDWIAPSLYPVTRIITAIEKCERLEECQCITVDSPTSTYLTNDCIVTHNSVLLGLLSLVEQVTLDASVLILGASETQAKVVYGYISQKTNRFPGKFWDYYNAPKALQDPKEERLTESRIITGGLIKVLPASETSIYGQRPSRLRIDECDLCDIELIDGAIPCAHPYKHPFDESLNYKSNILLSSACYRHDGTLNALTKRYQEKNDELIKKGEQPKVAIYHFCYKDVLEENGGHLTQEMLDEMKAMVTRQVWERQYENGEPMVDDCIFSDEDLDFFFDDSLGVFKGENHEKIRVDPSIYEDDNEIYYHGADFGDKIDWSIFSVFHVDKCSTQPDILVAWERHGRWGLTNSALAYDELLRNFPGPASHDGTGASQFVVEQLTEASHPVSWTQKFKHEALNAFIAAVERRKIKCPRIEYLEVEMKNLTYDKCFGSKHLPDSIASLIMAWYARRRVMRNFNIGGSHW